MIAEKEQATQLQIAEDRRDPPVETVSYRVDPTVCEAYGICFDVAGDIFDSDDWGYAKAVRTRELTAAERARAEEAFRLCPVKAIRRLT